MVGTITPLNMEGTINHTESTQLPNTNATSQTKFDFVLKKLKDNILRGSGKSELSDFYRPKTHDLKLAPASSFEATTLAKLPSRIERLFQDPNFLPKCFFLPYINHACYFHNNIVYLWNYKSERFQFYDNLKGAVLSVAVVKCREGMFSPVKYLLVIATTIDVVFLPLKLEPDGHVLLYASDYITSNESYMITKIIGSESGRIFMGTRRGDILELKYQLAGGLFPFSKKISITNCTKSFFAPLEMIFSKSTGKEIVTLKVDEERKTLYSLSLDSTLQIIDLGKEGDSFGLVGNAELGRHTARLQLGLCDDTFLQSIVDLHVIPGTDSSTLRLVAIAASGVSLFYKSSKQSNPARATQICLEFARPSTYTTYMNNDPLGMVSLYSRGLLFSASPSSGNSSGNSSTISASFIESTSATPEHDNSILTRTFNVGTRLLDALEQDLTPQSYLTNCMRLPGLNDAVSQYFTPARRINLITREGVIQLVKRRPVDRLYQTLFSEAPFSESLVVLAESFGPSECCSMILALLSEYPLALIENGCSLPAAPEHEVKNRLTQTMRDRLLLAFKELSGWPDVDNEPSSNPGYSNGFAGALLFSGRILTPLWKSRIITRKAALYELQISRETLEFSKSAIDRLLDVFSSIPTLAYGSTPSSTDENNLGDTTYAEAEKTSLYSLKNLLALSSQAMSFLLLLSCYPVDMFLRLTPTRLDQLLACNFDHLVTSSHLDIIQELVKLMMDRFPSPPVPSVHDFLKESCKELFSEQLPFLKGFELLKEARTLPQAKMLQLLKNAQSYFLNHKFLLSLPQLTEILRYYQELGFQMGALELIASNASKLPPQTPDVDSYYTIVSVPLDSIRAVLDSSSHVFPEHNDVKCGLMLLMGRVNDKRFHSAVYDWFCKNNLPNMLYEICSHFFIEYLSSSNFLDKHASRCCYYLTKKMYGAAANYLFEFAVSTDTLTLKKRIEFLRQAQGYTENVQTSDHSTNFFQLAKDIKARLQASLIQLKVVEEYSELHSENLVEAVLNALDSKLFTIQELYSSFVVPLNLSKSKRLIVSKDPLIQMQ